MNVYLDTLGLIALFAWMCSMYVRDLYRASRDFEDFEAMDLNKNFDDGSGR